VLHLPGTVPSCGALSHVRDDSRCATGFVWWLVGRGWMDVYVIRCVDCIFVVFAIASCTPLSASCTYSWPSSSGFPLIIESRLLYFVS
jgi:hypothetical protein